MILIKADYIDYICKYEDWVLINVVFVECGEVDDVLFVRYGLFIDIFYVNIVFWDGICWLMFK